MLIALIALLAGLVHTAPADGQQTNPTASLRGPQNVRPGQPAPFTVTLDPAPTTDLDIEFAIRPLSGAAASDFVDLGRSGFSSDPTPTRTVTWVAGSAGPELALFITNDAPASTNGQPAFLLQMTSVGEPYEISPGTAAVRVSAPGTTPPQGTPVAGPIGVLEPGVAAGAAAGPSAVTTVDEGGVLQFGVFLVEPSRSAFTATVLVNFPSPNNIDAASIADLTSSPALIPAGNGGNFLIEVPIPAGTAGVPVRLPTLADSIVPEGDAMGIERFQVSVVKLVDEAAGREFSGLTFADPLTLEISDPESVRDLTMQEQRRQGNRNRPLRLLPADEPVADPITGPLVSGAITASRADQVATLHLPSVLQVWLSPTSPVRVLHDGAELVTADRAPAKIDVDLSAIAERPITLTFQGRLRNGAVYTELITIDGDTVGSAMPQ